jgi:hypothetical protein
MKLLTGLLCMMATVAAAQGSEDSILSMYGDRAFRPDSGTLCIVTDRGDTLVFVDQIDTDYLEDYAVYELSSFLPEQNCWVITKTLCEWAVTLLVNGSSGCTVEAVSHPEPSPDGTRLLCTQDETTVGILQSGLQVWRVDPDSLVLEFQYRDEPWWPVDVEWTGDSLIVFEMLTFAALQYEFSSYPWSLRLSADGVWTPYDESDW